MELTNVQRERAIYFMRKYGGSFVQAMAFAYLKADQDNRRRLEKAFPEYFEKYANFHNDQPKKES